MSQIVQSMLEYAPYAGAMLGAGTGAVADVYARHQLAHSRRALAAEIGEAVGAQPEPSMMQRMRAVGGASLVAVGAVAGFANTIAWLPDATQTEPPFIGVVVDHSGAVASGNQAVKPFIDELAETFGDDGAYNAAAFIAGKGVSVRKDPEEVSNDVASGPAPLDRAFSAALAEAEASKKISRGGEFRAGTVVITNGNSISGQAGSAAELTAQANAQNIPVFVIDVESKNQATTKELQEVAKQTGGEYWDVNAKDVSAIADKVGDTLEDSRLKDTRRNPWPLRITAGALTLYSAAVAFRNRRREPTGINVQG